MLQHKADSLPPIVGLSDDGDASGLLENPTQPLTEQRMPVSKDHTRQRSPIRLAVGFLSWSSPESLHACEVVAGRTVGFLDHRDLL